LPYSTIEPMKEKLKARFQSESMESENTWMGRIQQSLNQVPVEVKARLGTSEITAREVLALKVGDVIQLRERAGSPLNVYVEEVLKFRGLGGTSRNAKAIKITEILQNKKKEEDQWQMKTNQKSKE
ncbi:MAG: FliM/FliN family flagellar motor switch protein, partial [Candidatus Sumerlaeota bacterium]